MGIIARIQLGCARLAPSPRFGSRLLETAARLRESRSPTRAQMAREVQHGRACHLVRSPVRVRDSARARLEARPGIPWRLGERSISVNLPAGPKPPGLLTSHAGMV